MDYSDILNVGKINSLLNYLIAAVVMIIAGSFFYFRDNSSAVTASPPKLSSHDVDKVVNKYIRETSTDTLRQKILSEQAFREAKKKIAELNRANQLRQQKEIENIPAAKQIWKESDVQLPPGPQVAEQTSDGRMTEQEKREYARQYIENARKGGYAIELNSDLEVIKVTPLRTPSQENDSYESYPSN